MGSCISKCRPKNKLQPLNLVHDKLVISQPPLTTASFSLSNKISPYPLSPSASTSSLSSFTCVSTNTTNASVSSCTSSATSAFTSKERFFSDDFLWSCYKENPHVIRINSLKANTLSSPAKVFRLNSPAKSVSPVVRQPTTPQRVSRSTPQKRVRSTSPTPATNLTRQKSFKKDIRPAERPSPAYSLSNRALSSPSPSRRLREEKCRIVRTSTVLRDRNDSKRMVGDKANGIGSVSLSTRKEYVKAAASGGQNSHSTSQARAGSMNKETCIHRISSKIDETAVGDAVSNHDFDSVIPMEDIDNPLISLDCFIFL